jgi:hypothetical protein
MLDTGVDYQHDFSHLDNYILAFDASSIMDSTGISAEHSVVLEIQGWSKSSDSQMLWVIGPAERVYPSSTSKIAASVVNSASTLSIPTISYFCDWPQKHQTSDPVVSLLYSLVRQLLNITCTTFNSGIGLSDRRLQLLNGSEQSLDEAVKLVKKLIWLVPPLTLCILDGIDHLDYVQGNRQTIEAVLLLLKERITSDNVSKKGTFKLLFTTAGNCGLLNKMGGGMLRDVKCSGRSQRQRSGKPGPGRSTLELKAGGIASPCEAYLDQITLGDKAGAIS